VYGVIQLLSRHKHTKFLKEGNKEKRSTQKKKRSMRRQTGDKKKFREKGGREKI
jgi:hypothetical protein